MDIVIVLETPMTVNVAVPFGVPVYAGLELLPSVPILLPHPISIEVRART